MKGVEPQFNRLWELAIAAGDADGAAATVLSIYAHARALASTPPDQLQNWANEMVGFILTEEAKVPK